MDREVREVTVLFADIRGFTTLSGGMDVTTASRLSGAARGGEVWIAQGTLDPLRRGEPLSERVSELQDVAP